MKFRPLVTSALAVLALAGCNKSKEATPAAADDSTVTITQAKPGPGQTWADVVNATSQGFLMGNPNAKVKLVEIGSLSCPHCKVFADEGVPSVINYVKGGNLSWEFRPYVIHGAVDVAANLLIRCNGPKTFFPLMEALYKDQETWLGKAEATPQDKIEKIQNLPTNQVFVSMASLMGLQDWAAARGLPQAKSNQCLSNQQMIDREVQTTADVQNQYPDFAGTPSFIINGTLLKDTASWDKLKPQLEEALK